MTLTVDTSGIGERISWAVIPAMAEATSKLEEEEEEEEEDIALFYEQDMKVFNYVQLENTIKSYTNNFEDMYHSIYFQAFSKRRT